MIGAGETWSVLYRSYASISENSPRQIQILRDYSDLVKRCGITGYLHREDEVLFQWFEGPKASVSMMLDLIRCHGSHHGLMIYGNKLQTQRVFSAWSHGSTTTNGVSLFNWANEISKPLHPNSGSALIDFLKTASGQRG
ncbi:BLUF domain-containing protein [Paracoccus aminophilus]|uniref:BLUF domain-containing protein n=1 Tax=Paracoccus aminophilus TaxID=34003 RepID=UPI0003FA20D4|nr:BLUF domain-containing protein [Paracoccus aminophilus]